MKNAFPRAETVRPPRCVLVTMQVPGECSSYWPIQSAVCSLALFRPSSSGLKTGDFGRSIAATLPGSSAGFLCYGYIIYFLTRELHVGNGFFRGKPCRPSQASKNIFKEDANVLYGRAVWPGTSSKGKPRRNLYSTLLTGNSDKQEQFFCSGMNGGRNCSG